MKQSIAYALISAALTALLITASPAPAQSVASEARTYVSFVPTGDLDLGTETGQRQLRQRLANAARAVCGVASDADLKGKNEVRKCREEAIARASAQRDVLAAEADRETAVAVTASR